MAEIVDNLERMAIEVLYTVMVNRSSYRLEDRMVLWRRLDVAFPGLRAWVYDQVRVSLESELQTSPYGAQYTIDDVLCPVPLGHTPGHDQRSAAAMFLVLRHLQDGVNGLLLRLVDKRAGIDHKHVSFGGIARQLVARLPREAQHDLGVDEVFWTPERNHADLHQGYSLCSIRGYGMVSRTCSSLQIHDTQRSIPMPNPP